MEEVINSSESSSEDECNIYINAASRLNALNRKIKLKCNKDDYDDVLIIDDSKKFEDIETDLKGRNDSNYIDETANNSFIIENSINDIYCIDDSRDVLVNNKNLKTNSVICIENDLCSNYDNSNRRITRSLSKKNYRISRRAQAVVDLSDSIDEELDKSFSMQEENDSYIVIGSPPPNKNYDNDNYEVNVKVLWKSNKMNRFEIRRYETFQKIFQHFAKIEKVPENQILIMKKNRPITPFDSPISIDWSIIDILDGGIVSADVAKRNNENSIKNIGQENICKIKVQVSEKKSLLITLKPNEIFKVLLQSCAEQLGISESKLKLYFDGDLLDLYDTPESLDLDDEACIDLKILD